MGDEQPNCTGPRARKMAAEMLKACKDNGDATMLAEISLMDGPELASYLEQLAEVARSGLFYISLQFGFARLPYEGYLLSDHWQEVRGRALEAAGFRCQVCNRSRDDAVLDVHHRTYERLGFEEPADLTVLCRKCHGLFHSSR